MLVRARCVPFSALERALAQQAESGARVGQLLTAAGDAREDDVQQFLRLQALESLHTGLLQKSGRWRFQSTDAVEALTAMQPGLDCSTVLIEALQHSMEQPGIESQLGDGRGKMRVRRALDAAEAPADLEDDALWSRLPDEDDRRVYALVAGGETALDAVIDRSRLGAFAARRALARLIRFGCIDRGFVGELRRNEDHTAQVDVGFFQEILKRKDEP
nr:hypothetical protein [uncultured bacterium]